MENSQTQKDLVKAWAKIGLNSCYYPTSFNYFILYNENKSLQIAEEGKNNIKLLQEALKNVV